MTPILTKWVYIIKSDGRYKARLVVQGCKQEKEPQEHQSIFAPVVKGVTIRLIIAQACMLRLHIYQMDVSNAFCYTDIAGYVYVGTSDDEEVESGWCHMLQKSLYGLRSSPRSWIIHIDKFIKSLNFQSCVLDPCLCYQYHHGQLALICVYVDDIIICTSDMQYMVEIKNSFLDRYDMTAHHWGG